MNEQDYLVTHNCVNERHALSMIALLGLPENYLDIGSGIGSMVNIVRKLGVEAYGIDRIPRVEGYFIRHDLSIPVDLEQKFKLVSCIEVIEHINERQELIILDTICKHIDLGGILVFTAALPGQSGYEQEHINLKQPYYWREKLTDYGLSYHELLTIRLSLIWSNLFSPLMHLSANVQVFTKGRIDWGTLKSL